MNTSIEQSFSSLTKKVNFLIRERNTIIEQNKVEKFITNEEFEALMKISPATSHHWRRARIIGYTQIYGKIYYTLKDINIMMQTYKFPSR